VATSAVSLFYYLRILKQALITPSSVPVRPIHVAPMTATVLIILALLTVILGVFPQWLLQSLQ